MPGMVGSGPSRGEQAVNTSMPAKQAENMMAELDALRSHGQAKLADRLESLLKKTALDDDVIDAESVSHMIRFIIVNGNHLLPNPYLGINPGGLVQAVWRVKKGTFAMNFHHDGKLRFAAVIHDGDHINMTGTIPAEEALKHLRLLWMRYVPGYAEIDKTGGTYSGHPSEDGS